MRLVWWKFLKKKKFKIDGKGENWQKIESLMQLIEPEKWGSKLRDIKTKLINKGYEVKFLKTPDIALDVLIKGFFKTLKITIFIYGG